MIKSFADKITEHLFEGRAVKRIDMGLQKQALRRLRYLDAATQLDDLRAPLQTGWKLCKVIAKVPILSASMISGVLFFAGLTAMLSMSRFWTIIRIE